MIRIHCDGSPTRIAYNVINYGVMKIMEIPRSDNNLAEYIAIHESLKYIKDNIKSENVIIYSDSQNVIRVLVGKRPERNKTRIEYYKACHDIINQITNEGGTVDFRTVERKKNEAGKLLDYLRRYKSRIDFAKRFGLIYDRDNGGFRNKDSKEIVKYNKKDHRKIEFYRQRNIVINDLIPFYSRK